MSIKPEDILPDDKNTLEINGLIVRKATMAALLANADLLLKKESTIEEKVEAKETIKELAPGLIAAGLLRHLSWKNPDIQEIFEKIQPIFNTKD